MGRRPSSPGAIPRLRPRKKGSKTFYYYDHGLVDGKRHEEPLGCDYGMAIKRWAEIEHAGAEKPAAVITFRYVADRYRAEVIPTKAPRTQRDNAKELKQLITFFDDPPCPLEAIQPQHVRQYLQWRGEKAKVRANREKALLSHIWNWARATGYTALANPCAGVKGFKETGRDVYVEDDMFEAVWKEACRPLRDAMDLAYLTGQRVADTLKMDLRDVRDGFLHVQQNKTAAKRRIEVVGDLATLLDRIAARKSQMTVHATRLVVREDGQPLTHRQLQERFAQAREAAGIEPKAFQFRDLRAKAGTDKTDAGDIRQAQQQLGHTSVVMTEQYVRNRRGAKVTPTR
ncbi:MAG TPA: tyrosine-type recombinase/integrase [Frateuria sp.]|uniref:tyrosine-type recombinase/integrase n=1 Tax=Frateuria sp. TaxID=2211372 RepID=UPI002DE78A27|nr:tyrosine-type recombinase/integrase [Frateuria sp.]